jgi:hypothetical protein
MLGAPESCDAAAAPMGAVSIIRKISGWGGATAESGTMTTATLVIRILQ